MTQLQIIQQEFAKLSDDQVRQYGLMFWKREMAENPVQVMVEIRKEVARNRNTVVAWLGELIVQMIEQFDPLKESDKYLTELMELYRERKDLRQWDKIRVKVAECNMLLEMAAKK